MRLLETDVVLNPLYDDLNTPGFIAVLHKLFDKANDSLLPIRERYFELKEQKDLIKDHLTDGAKKVRPLAQEFIEEIRSKIGIS